MANGDGKVVISTKLDNSGLKKGINNISGSLGGLKSVLGKLGGIVAAAFSVKAIIDFSKAAIDLGSDLEEVQNVVDVSFGSMADACEEFASTAITKFGMSELAAKQTASTYMAMAKGMGVAEGAASDMSIALAGLSGDVASFYNLDQEDAAKKLQGVFTGESEALKSLGVVMTQTNLKQFALEKGLNANIEAMSQAELVALRYAFVTDALSLASGDFVRTQDSWANQTRILSMQWQQFMGIIGQTLTTVLTPAIKLLNSLVTVLINVAQKIQTVVANLFGKAVTQTNAVAESAAAGAAAQENLADAVTKAGKAAKKSLAGFDELNVLQSADTSGGDSAETGAGLGGVSNISGGTVTVSSEVQDNITPKIEALIEKIRGFGETIKTAFMPSISAWGEAFSSLAPSIEEAGGRISFAWTTLKDTALVPFATYITTDFIPSIVNDFSTTFAPIFADVMPVAINTWTTDFENGCLLVEEYCGILQTAYEGVKTVFSDMCESISSNWDTYGGDLLQGFTDFKDGLWETWWYIYDNIINPVITSCSETLSWLWDEHLKPLWDSIVEFVLSVSENILALWNGFIKPVVDYVVAYLAPIVTNVINGIWDAICIVFAWISDVINGLLKYLDGFIQFIVGVFTLDWERAWGGIKKMFEGVWTSFEGTVKGVVNAIIWVINQLIAAIYSGIAGIVNGLGSVVKTVGNMLGQNWGFSIPTRAPRIPYLAQGAVLPPNKPFMAVVGDQRHGTNVEAPLATIQEAVALVMQDQTQAILAGFEASVGVQREILEAVLGIQIGDDVIGNAVSRYNHKQAVIRGGVL